MHPYLFSRFARSYRASFHAFSMMIKRHASSPALPLTFTVNDQKNKNAISQRMLIDLSSQINDLDASSARHVRILFATDQSDYSCSGYNFHDFDISGIQEDKCAFYDDDPACQVLAQLHEVNTTGGRSEIVIEKSLVGYGLVLASACAEIIFPNPANVSCFLPHFRLGVSFPYVAMASLLNHFGYDLSTELMISPRSISGEEMQERIHRNRHLSQADLNHDLTRSIEKLGDIAEHGATMIDGKAYQVEDRAGYLSSMAHLHILQYQLFHQFGMGPLPSNQYESMELLRAKATGPGLARVLVGHAKRPKKINRDSVLSVLSRRNLCLFNSDSRQQQDGLNMQKSGCQGHHVFSL